MPNKLPKHLLCESTETDKAYIFHTAEPKFVMVMGERNEDGSIDSEEVHWIDDPPTEASEVARLMKDAGDFYANIMQPCAVCDNCGLFFHPEHEGDTLCPECGSEMLDNWE